MTQLTIHLNDVFLPLIQSQCSIETRPCHVRSDVGTRVAVVGHDRHHINASLG
jgi:hypothetical protein